MSPDEIANLLWEMQAPLNENRGVCVIRTICNLLRANRIEEATATAIWDWDKIRSYPEIGNALIEHLDLSVITNSPWFTPLK